jgi:hypothetical protein
MCLVKAVVGPVIFVLLAAGAAAQLSDIVDLARFKEFAAFRSSSNNQDHASNDDSKRPIPGETTVLADLDGPGVVTHIWLTLASNEYGFPRLLRLRIYYDGSTTPSVDTPVGDFFAVGLGQERDVSSMMVRNSSSGRARNFYWPMPFRKSCRITVTNEGRRRTSNLYYHVDWRKLKELPFDVGYLHARYRQELPTVKGKRYEILDVKGRGHYVGTVFSIIQNQPGWFGEGDEFFYIDGAEKASIEGTGTEDYFNDAWSLRVSNAPYYGVTLAEGTGLGSRMSAYRWHVVDPIPFTRSLKLEIEHAGWTFNEDGGVRSAFEERSDLFSSVAFWYQEGIAEGRELPYGPARLPHGNARQIEVEEALDQVETEAGKAEVQKEVFWSRDLLFFQAAGPGSKIHVPFDIAQDGDYELLAQIAHSPDYGIYEVTLDGKPLLSDVTIEHEPGANLGLQGQVDAYYTETYVAEDHMLGWKKLSRGRHVLTFTCTGKNTRAIGHNLGIDTLILSRLGHIEAAGGARAERMRSTADAAILREGLSDSDEFVRQASAWNLTQNPKLAAGLAPLLETALGDKDAVVRGLAALAFVNCAGCARGALKSLVAALKDEDSNVRMKSAEAIASIGREGAPAVPTLIQALEVQDENPQVLRSVAMALGSIGAAAAPAIGALEKTRAIPRVQTQADDALRRIRSAR